MPQDHAKLKLLPAARVLSGCLRSNWNAQSPAKAAGLLVFYANGTPDRGVAILAGVLARVPIVIHCNAVDDDRDAGTIRDLLIVEMRS
jgi:hypothetical protein